MKIGIDLTWLKPKKSGGVESYLRNLLDGMLELDDKNEYVLFTSLDNDETFNEYLKDSRVKKIVCNTKANDVLGHLIWQNLKQYKILKENNIDFCFFPVYEMPLYKNKKIKTVTTIHDLQAIHYPEYFSYLEKVWFKLGWKAVLKNANRVVAISDFTKKDLINNFKTHHNITRIYNPIVLNDDIKVDFKELHQKYNIKKDNYYYTVCSLYKHKNLMTLINVMEHIKDKENNIPNTLVISGVSGPQKEELQNIIKEKNLTQNIILTGFVSNEERNALIKNSNVFLFPSLFEGFGMPPIEAKMLGSRVITTKCASLKEVTKNKCSYVNNPTNVNEWIKKIKEIQKERKKSEKFIEYDKKNIAREYLDLFYKVRDENEFNKRYLD